MSRIVQPVSARNHVGAGRRSAFHGLQHLLKLAPIDNRSEVVFIRGPHPKSARGLEQPRAEFIIDGIENNDPASGGATLPGVAERRKKSPPNRFVEIGVIADNQRVLAPQFEGKFCEPTPRRDGNFAADRAGTCETDHADVGMGNQGRARLGPVSVDDIEHAIRQSCLLRDPPEQRGGLPGYPLPI